MSAAGTGRLVRNRVDVGLVVAGALLTGSSSTLVRLAQVSPSTAAFFRAAFAIPVLAFLARRESRRGRRLVGGDLRRAVAAGVFLGIDLLLWYHSINTLGAGLSTVVQDTQVVFVAAGAWLVLGQRPSRAMLCLIPVLLLGVMLIADPRGSAGGGGSLRGTILAVASAAAYAGFILLLRRPSPEAGAPATYLLAVTAATAVTALVAGLGQGDLQLAPTWPGIGWLLVLSFTTQVVGWLVISAAMARVGMVRAAMALLLQSAAAVAYACLILGEVPTTVQLSGVAVVIAGVAVAAAVPTGAAPPVLPDAALPAPVEQR